ncbi:18400_t:CDS:2, partial [Racocetra fulgida]
MSTRQGPGIRISIDRGGTFTDCIGIVPVPTSKEYPTGRREIVIKLLSDDPQNYPDAPREGIRRILEIATGKPHPRNKPVDTSLIANDGADIIKGISGEYVKVLQKPADAYLTPCIRKYIDGFVSGFDENMEKNTRLEFMQSDGGLVPVNKFSGFKAILSGPAGGVVGYASTSFSENERDPVIGFDMGDVSRFDGLYEHVFETTTAGITIQAPQLDINT